MSNFTRTGLTILIMSFLASCGGSGGNPAINSAVPGGQGASGSFPTQTPQSISSIFGVAGSGAITVGQIDTATQHLSSLMAASDENRVTIERPTDARVTLNGLIGVGDDVKMTVGRLSMDADFTNNQLTGTAADFSSFTGGSGTSTVKTEDLSGTLALSNGIITGSALMADIDGVLSGADNVTFDAQMRGSFLNVDGLAHAIGTFDGTATTDNAAPESFDDGSFLVSE